MVQARYSVDVRKLSILKFLRPSVGLTTWISLVRSASVANRTWTLSVVDVWLIGIGFGPACETIDAWAEGVQLRNAPPMSRKTSEPVH